MNAHAIQAIAVLILLLAGWMLGTSLIARRARGTRERAFIIRTGVALLCGVLAFSALDYFVFKSSGAVLGPLLFVTVLLLRRRQLQIRRQEAGA